VDFGWITWIALLVTWPLVGLGMAYLFGSILRSDHRTGTSGESNDS